MMLVVVVVAIAVAVIVVCPFLLSSRNRYPYSQMIARIQCTNCCNVDRIDCTIILPIPIRHCCVSVYVCFSFFFFFFKLFARSIEATSAYTLHTLRKKKKKQKKTSTLAAAKVHTLWPIQQIKRSNNIIYMEIAHATN